jgi:hypothetical protein
MFFISIRHLASESCAYERIWIQMTVFWDVARCGMVEIDRLSRDGYRLHNQGSSHLWNVGKLPPVYTALHPRRQSSSYWSLWEPEISGTWMRFIFTDWLPLDWINASHFNTGGLSGAGVPSEQDQELVCRANGHWCLSSLPHICGPKLKVSAMPPPPPSAKHFESGAEYLLPILKYVWTASS